MIQLSACLLTVTRDTVGTHRRCCRELRSTDHSARRTPTGPLPRTDEQVLESITQIQSSAGPRCQTSWSVRSGRAVLSMTSRRTSRGVSKLKYPVEHSTATDWDDGGKGVDHVTVLINGMESLAWILVLRQL